jgi:hypothetical protein
MLQALGEFGRTLLFLVGGAVFIGALAHGLGWLLTRRRAATFVWEAWNLVGAVLLGVGLVVMAYGWWAHGLQSGTGNLLLGTGLLLASAGLWMLVPV